MEVLSHVHLIYIREYNNFESRVYVVYESYMLTDVLPIL